MPAGIESALRASVNGSRSAVVQRQGKHFTELGRYQDRAVAKAALEEMVAKGSPREELAVRKIKG